HSPEQRPGPRKLREARMLHRVDAALYVVEQTIARPLVHGADCLAVGSEGNFDWIIEAAAAQALDIGAVDPAAPDAGGQAFQDPAIPGLDRVAVAAIGPVQSAIGSEEGAVNVAPVAVEAKARHQLTSGAGNSL